VGQRTLAVRVVGCEGVERFRSVGGIRGRRGSWAGRCRLGVETRCAGESGGLIGGTWKVEEIAVCWRGGGEGRS